MTRKPTLFAVDTSFLLDRADQEEWAEEASQIIHKRVPGAVVLVPPTVIDELAWGVENWTGKKQALAVTALTKLKRDWRFQPVDLIPAGHGIVEVDAAYLRACGLLPESERNDSFVVIEAALLDCTMLISCDEHLWGIDPGELRRALADKDLSVVLIKSPRALVETFGGRVRRI